MSCVQVVQYKQQSRLEEKRKKALDLQLDFIVGQTEKYSDLLSKSLAPIRPPETVTPAPITPLPAAVDDEGENLTLLVKREKRLLDCLCVTLPSELELSEERCHSYILVTDSKVFTTEVWCVVQTKGFFFYFLCQGEMWK